MDRSPALDHLLRTMAAVPPEQRVLLRGAEGVARPLARMGFELHVAPWDDPAARRVQEAVEAGEAGEAGEALGPVYTTAAPLHALPYPEAHFGWVVARVPGLERASQAEREEVLGALLDEARHHLRPGGWVFMLAPGAPAPGAPATVAPEALTEAAARAGLAVAEAPEEAGATVHAIYRRVGPGVAP